MGRFAAGVAALAIAVAAWTPASAQSLATLHVRRFSIALDRTSVRTGESFHLTMTARLDEPVAELNNVTLPDLAGLDVTGDERRCSATPHGSDCSETLTLAATVPGDRTLGPWTMDAIDAHNHRASRFSSNTVILHVAGPSPFESFGGIARDLAVAALVALGAIALLVLASWALLRRLRRPRPVLAPPVVHVAHSEPLVPARDSLHELVAALADEPTRERVVAVRDAVRASLGAGEHETCADLVARNAGNGATASALRALERAAFCEDARVADAAREALPFLMR